ncbi:adenylosuccinate lyase [Staphylococcus aureus]|nr:adenylosuccinate lyase [Staphylococcus aureus]
MKFVTFKKPKQEKLKKHLQKVKKGHLQCLINEIQLVSENITGISRVIRGYITTAYENVPLWHERDISHSSAERIMLPDVTIALDYALNRVTNIVDV